MKSKLAFGTALVASLMAFGTAAHAQTGPSGDMDRDVIPTRRDNDRDGDGFANTRDPNPNVFNRTRIVRGYDMDGDGIADRSDRDRDGDRVVNARDHFPNDPRRS